MYNTFKLSFDFDVINKDGSNSEFKQGEFFMYTPAEGGRYIAFKDMAQISLDVAKKIGRDMKKRMFVAL